MTNMTNVWNTVALRLALVLQGPEVPSVEREEGQTLAEYALILALIAILVIGAVLFLSGQISGIFSTIGNAM
jgi:pilus assembly protein Flp/PilA